MENMVRYNYKVVAKGESGEIRQDEGRASASAITEDGDPLDYKQVCTEAFASTMYHFVTASVEKEPGNFRIVEATVTITDLEWV